MSARKILYGVFTWGPACADYKREKAHKVYKSAAAAEKYAGSRNLVVRSLDADTGDLAFVCRKGK